MIPIALRLKALIPGYRNRWQRHYALLLDHFRKLAPQLRLGEEEGTPWLETAGLRFYGFWPGDKERQQLFLLGNSLPPAIPPEYYRLAKDYVTRFLYPHMRPDLSPIGITPANWGGFHGQHKESLADYSGADAAFLRRQFTPQPDEVIIDGGCFVGMGDIHMSRLLPDGHIYAVEADAACHALLRRNLEQNRIANVTPFHRAMWKEDTFLDLESDHAQANTLVSEVHVGRERVRVRTIGIDQLVEEQSISRVDMISMTLNGAEVESLEGARETLRRFRPRVKLPGWYLRNGVPIWKISGEYLEGMGYRVFTTPRGNVLAVHPQRAK